MILSHSIKSVWNKHKEEITKLYLADLNKPLLWQNLEYCYTDLKGQRYARFNKSMHLPVDRLGMLCKFEQYLAKGLSPEEDIEIDKAIEAALQRGLENPGFKAAASIGALLYERDKRRQLGFHTELFYNCISVQWVREDEDPFRYDNEIQRQKVDQFKEEQGGNLMFFFHQPELKKLSDFLKLTAKDVLKLQEDSNAEMILLKEKLEYFKHLNNTSKNSSQTGVNP